MRVGKIELNEGGLGGWDLCSVPVNALPEQLATAIGVVNSGLLGATYVPIRLVGTQVVNGMNYMLIAKEVRATRTKDEEIVLLVINIPAGDISGEKATVVSIIEETKLPDEVQDAFDGSVGQLHGVNYTPLLYIGSQVVKGINYYVLCEAKVVYPGAEPTAVVVCFNAFQEHYTVVSIEQVEAFDIDPDDNAPLGEWP